MRAFLCVLCALCRYKRAWSQTEQTGTSHGRRVHFIRIYPRVSASSAVFPLACASCSVQLQILNPAGGRISSSGGIEKAFSRGACPARCERLGGTTRAGRALRRSTKAASVAIAAPKSARGSAGPDRRGTAGGRSDR
jgi:hypothetical protein